MRGMRAKDLRKAAALMTLKGYAMKRVGIHAGQALSSDQRYLYQMLKKLWRECSSHAQFKEGAVTR